MNKKIFIILYLMITMVNAGGRIPIMILNNDGTTSYNYCGNDKCPYINELKKEVEKNNSNILSLVALMGFIIFVSLLFLYLASKVVIKKLYDERLIRP